MRVLALINPIKMIETSPDTVEVIVKETLIRNNRDTLTDKPSLWHRTDLGIYSGLGAGRGFGLLLWVPKMSQDRQYLSVLVRRWLKSLKGDKGVCQEMPGEEHD